MALLALVAWPDATAWAQGRPPSPADGGAPATPAPAWSVCIQVLPGVAGHPPYYRDCRPLPPACRATPNCACMARVMPDPFRYACRRAGHRFIRHVLALP